jgi:2'-5' RNA ligase
MGKLMNIPAYRQAQYLLILQPHEDLRNRIIQQKQAFYTAYQTPSPGGRPHITLAQFVTWQMSEERLCSRLRTIAMGSYPFKVELNGYGSFPAHTIYINVTTKNHIQELVKELKAAQRLMKSSDSSPHFITEPHITLANKLLPWQYEKAWLEYEHKHFTGSFIAGNILLIKRPLKGTAWQIVERFELMNLPVSTKQGALFV